MSRNVYPSYGRDLGILIRRSYLIFAHATCFVSYVEFCQFAVAQISTNTTKDIHNPPRSPFQTREDKRVSRVLRGLRF